MDTLLNRVDYAQVGTTSKGCLKLLPLAEKTGGQKVIVGGHNGILLCFTRANRDTSVIFKTLPAAKIECLCLGGALNTPQDKAFFATNNVVKGYTKKGKQFFGFETNLTEPITSLFVYGVDMLLCGTYTFNHYHDSADVDYYLCGDKINDVICLPVLEGSWVGRGITTVLAVDDHTIKVLEGSKVVYDVQLGGAPNVLQLFDNTGGEEGSLVLYGTKDGRVGLVDLPLKGGILKWEVQSPNGNAAITGLHCYDLSKSGSMDIIVGRDDGYVEIYAKEALEEAAHRQGINCHESITSVVGGRVGSRNFDEIVVCTYTGWVFGLTTEPVQKEVGPNQQMTLDSDVEKKIHKLRVELEDLQSQVAMERERYHQSTQDEDGLSAVPLFAVNDRFALNKDEAAYLLAVELMMPIDYVLLQSENALLATYRCQANTTRLEMKIRSIEGQYGTIKAYISPRMHPKICQVSMKSCDVEYLSYPMPILSFKPHYLMLVGGDYQVRQYPIKPLSLHQRSHNYDTSRPQNSLKLLGSFSLAEAHSWMVFCLPDLPEKPPPGETALFCFFSTFTGTQLECSYSGMASFRSDNVSTIAILRDVLSKEATKKKIKLDISCDINEDSVAHTLQLLHPKLEYQLNLAKKVHLAEALKELSVQETDKNFMTDDFMEILNKSDELAVEHRRQQAHLERIYGVVTDLYIDKHKFKGVSVKQKVPALLHVLDNYTLDSLIAFFQS